MTGIAQGHSVDSEVVSAITVVQANQFEYTSNHQHLHNLTERELVAKKPGYQELL